MTRPMPDRRTFDQRVVRFEVRPSGGDPQAIVREVVDAGGQVLVASAMENYRGAIFDSKVSPVIPEVDLKFVPELLRLAHENGLLVLSWYYLGAHMLLSQKHPEWKVKTLADPESLHPRHDYEMCMLSSPYRDYVKAATAEILSLGFDGFWFDGGEVQAWWLKPVAPGCYCPWCQKAFREEFGADIPTRVDWDDHLFGQWVKWRYRRFDEFLTELHNHLAAIAGDAILLMDHYNRPSIFSDDPANATNWISGVPCDVMRTKLGGGGENVYSVNRTHTTGYNARLLKAQCPERFDVWEPSGLVAWHAGRPDNAVHRIVHGVWTMAIGGSPWTAGGTRRCGKPDRTMADELVRHVPTMGGESLFYCGIHHSLASRDFRGRDLTGNYYREGYGLYAIATEGHFLTDFVFDGHLTDQAYLRRFKVIVLPNSACLSDDQAQALRTFVRNGGVLIATFETSLYDEWGRRRQDFALADVFGVHYTETVNLRMPPGGRRYAGHGGSLDDCPTRILDTTFASDVADIINFDADYARIVADRKDEIFAEVQDARTREWEPAIVVRRYGQGVGVYCHAEAGRSFLHTPLTEIRQVFEHFLSLGAPQIEVTGPRIVEMTAFWREGNILAVHLVNLPFCSNRPPLPHEAMPVLDEVPVLADVTVHVRGIQPSQVTAPINGQTCQVRHEGDTAHVTVPRLHYHEVILFHGVTRDQVGIK